MAISKAILRLMEKAVAKKPAHIVGVTHWQTASNSTMSNLQDLTRKAGVFITFVNNAPVNSEYEGIAVSTKKLSNSDLSFIKENWSSLELG